MLPATKKVLLKLLLVTIKQLRALARKLIVWKTINYTCYEFGHTWTPSCRQAALDVFWSSLKASLKIYSSVYLVTAILRQRKLTYYLIVVWKDILRSTAFLTANAFCFISSFCAWSHLVGGFDRINAYASGALASTLALTIIEQHSRHSILALYTTNLGLETLYNMLVNHSIFPKVAYGEIALFSTAMAGFLHFYRVPGALDSFTYRLMSTIFGTDEIAQVVEGQESRCLSSLYKYLPQFCKNLLARVTSIQMLRVKHSQCTHQWGCLLNFTQRFFESFGIGYSISVALQIPKVIGLLQRGKNPIGQLLLNKDNTSCGIFLATLSSVHQSVSCLLRWGRGKSDSDVDGMIAGAVAGLSLYFYRSSAVSLYVLIRLVDLLCRRWSEQGKLPTVSNGYVYLYALSTALLFHAAVWEPHSIRPSYWRFILTITGGKFAEMNRQLIDREFGSNCSKLYPHFWPKYDPQFTDLLTPDCLQHVH